MYIGTCVLHAAHVCPTPLYQYTFYELLKETYTFVPVFSQNMVIKCNFAINGK